MMNGETNPLDVLPDEIPFDISCGPPVSLDQAQAVIHAAVEEAKKRNWKMKVAVVDSGGNLALSYINARWAEALKEGCDS